MTSEQSKKLSFIIRQMRDVVKHSIDELSELAESALTVFVDNESANCKTLPAASTKENLLTKKELSERLKVSQRTISEWQTEGLPIVKKGRLVRFEYCEVLAWMKNEKVKSRRKSNLRMVK